MLYPEHEIRRDTLTAKLELRPQVYTIVVLQQPFEYPRLYITTRRGTPDVRLQARTCWWSPQYDHCLTRYKSGMKDSMKTASTIPHLAISIAVLRLLRRLLFVTPAKY